MKKYTKIDSKTISEGDRQFMLRCIRNATTECLLQWQIDQLKPLEKRYADSNSQITNSEWQSDFKKVSGFYTRY